MPTLTPEKLTRIADALLKGAGVPAGEAATGARHLVAANLAGHDSHGVIAIPDYIGRIQKGHIVPGAPFTIVQESATTTVVDGNWGFGFVTNERAMAMTAALATLADPEAPPGALDLAIEVGDSVMTHRRRFSLATTRVTVIDLLALDEMNPRSVRYQLDGLAEQLRLLPGGDLPGAMSDLSRAMLRLHTDLVTERPEDLTTERLWDLRDRIGALSDLLTEGYLR